MLDTVAIDKAIAKNIHHFSKPGILSVRPGYKIKGGWITGQNAIVIMVAKKRKKVPAKQHIPKKIGGFPTDVRQATTWEKLRHADPHKHAAVLAVQRAEFAQPDFPEERDAQTGQLLARANPRMAVAATGSKPRIPYTPAQGVSLTPVFDTMSMTLCASPDAGWLVLEKFLAGVNAQLTIGMYDFTSAHILAAFKNTLAGKQQLSLVLDHPAPNPTSDQTDEATEQALSTKLGNRQSFAWAAEGSDPKVTSAIFPNAYHIKVAVKDHSIFWLSSGNFNNSNQPDIDPFAPNANMNQINATAKKSDRDWHAVVQHPGLAKVFEAYLKHDLEVARAIQVSPAGKKVAASAAPDSAKTPSPEKPILGKSSPSQYFPPFKIVNQKVKVQPILTPDTGAGNYVANIMALIDSATKKLYMQTQYIHPPDPAKYPGFQKLIEAVKKKIAAGVDVRIILSEYEATGGWLEKLQAAGIDASKYVRIQNGVHNKGFVVDSKVVALGSQNWSGDGVEKNRDASLILFHAGAAQYFEKIFLHDWDNLAKPKLSGQVSSK
ncbi:MAG: phospholipase D-like domain-containing protein [Bacteroidota bacterium]